MNSTWGKVPSRATRARRLLGAVLIVLGITRVQAADSPMPRPPDLERDVQFWIRVYSEVDTNGGFLHDQWYLGLVYDELHFAPNVSPRERQRMVDEGKEHYAAALRRIA